MVYTCLYHPFMVIRGMVYYCYTHMKYGIQPNKMDSHHVKIISHSAVDLEIHAAIQPSDHQEHKNTIKVSPQNN